MSAEQRRLDLWALLAVAFAAGVRAVPELLFGPWSVGFDAIAVYAPFAKLAQDRGLAFAVGGAIDSRAAPFAFLLLGLGSGLGGPPLLTTKLFGVAAYGFLAFACHRLAVHTFRLNSRDAFFATAFVMGYFLTLRIGLDLFRNVLGYGFFLLLLSEESRHSRPNPAWFALALLVLVTHELVAVLLVAYCAMKVFNALRSKRRVPLAYAAVAVLGVIALAFYLQWIVPAVGDTEFIREPGAGGILIDYGHVSAPRAYATWFELVFDVALITAVAFAPFLPAWGAKAPWTTSLAWLIALLAVLAVSPVLSPFLAPPLWHRWLFLLSVPLGLTVFARLRRSGVRRQAFAIGAVAILGLAYVALPDGSPLPYFATPVSVYLPSSMVQSSVRAQDIPHLLDAIRWLDGNAPSTAVLHPAMYGWVFLYAVNLRLVFVQHLEDAPSRVPSGGEPAFTIWWVSGVGWHSAERVDPGWPIAYRSGDIAVYRISP